jgi:hypothetical protein
MSKNRRIYNEIENGINYTVFECLYYYYLNKFESESGLKCDNPNIKIIVNDGETNDLFDFEKGIYRVEIYYYYEFVSHNLYGPSFIRYLNTKFDGTLEKICETYSIYGKTYNYKDWMIKRNYYLRKEKLLRLKN